jgi:RNA-directed DNA polymerase
MQTIARRIVDADMLGLIKQWLKAPVETFGEDGGTRMAGGRANKMGVPQGGVISPLVANLYMNRFLKYWRRTGRGEAWDAHVINYADDFVSPADAFRDISPLRGLVLSRGHAAEALAWNRAYYAMFCGISGCTQERI